MISRAKTRPHTLTVVLLLLIFSLFLVACERPLDGDAPEEDTTATATADPNQGGGVAGEPTEAPQVEEAPTEVAPTAEESSIPSDDPDSASVPEESDEGEAEESTEEAVEEVDEAAEEMAEEAEEAVEEAADEAVQDEPEEEETSAPGGTEGDSEVGGGVDEEGAETGDSEVGGGVDEAATAEETTEAEEAEADSDAAASEDAEAESVQTGEERIHVVQPGENLFRIGLQYGLSWVELANYNNLPNANSIYAGQQLRIPGDSDSDDGGEPDTSVTYVVQPGDTLYEIGRAFDIDWREIATANNLQYPYRIYVGQVLTISADSSPPPPEVTHVVRWGETLYSISLRYHVPWNIIADANELDAPYLIYAGQQLVIPASN